MTSKYIVHHKDDLDYDARAAFDYIDDTVFSMVKSPCIVAGGFLRNLINCECDEQCDIDIYFPNKEALESTFTQLVDQGATEKWRNANAVNLQVGDRSFDLVHKFHKGPIDVLDSFDFTVCCCMVDRRTMMHHVDYRDHLKNRRIVMNGIANDACRILERLQKYSQKGYSADPKTLEDMANRIYKSKYDGTWGKINPSVLSSPKKPKDSQEIAYVNWGDMFDSQRQVAGLTADWSRRYTYSTF